MGTFDLLLTIAGLAALGAALVPPLLEGRALSFPVVYVAMGVVVFALPLGLDPPNPLEDRSIFERYAELTVIVALMAAGLKLDRRPGVRRWGSTWRLLGVAMPLTIAAMALVCWWLGGLPLATALLVGACLAPTDPTLAGAVQVRHPYESHEDEPRFALTSEAGLNDALAFPFVNAAVAIALVGAAPGGWLGDWVLVDVVYRLGVGFAGGYLIGGLLAGVVFRMAAAQEVSDAPGFVAGAATLLTYGLTEIAGGYGFLAVFVAAIRFRHHQGSHRYHEHLYTFAEAMERLFVAGLLLLFGGALVAGVLGPVDGEVLGAVALFVLVVRPASGWIALAGSGIEWRERLAIAFLGIRGMGSIYYLAYGLGAASFAAPEKAWAIVTLTIVVSVVLHGATAVWVMRRADDTA